MDLKIALISNEGRGLTEHRVRKFHLRELAEFMIFSNCVGYRKPDREIWRLALGSCAGRAARIDLCR